MTKYSFLVHVFFIQTYILLLSPEEATAKPKARAHPGPIPWDWQHEASSYPTLRPYSPQLKGIQPEFLPVPRNTSVFTGDISYLPCRVRNLEEHYTVSWIRAADVTVLSVGQVAFSSDQRFSVIQVPRPRISASDWTLVIANVTKEDEGVYECQVNTDPKINKKHYLTVGDSPEQKDSPYDSPVIEPSVEYQRTHSIVKQHHAKEEIETNAGFSMFLHENGCLCPKPEFKRYGEYSNDDIKKETSLSIIGAQVQYVSYGSGFGLECILSGSDTSTTKLYWKKDNEVVTAKQRPGISLETERFKDSSRSHLYVSKAHLKDSGNYSCISDNTHTASVLLVVTPGSNFHSKNMLREKVSSQAWTSTKDTRQSTASILAIFLSSTILFH